MRKRILAVIPISLLVIFGLTFPATAFYFDFQYFETDKMVYEVGETIEMAARLIADFSPEGWCYVSFAVVTDLGPTFADEYFIPPLPEARIVNSSYTILPEHTNPGENDSLAFVLFNVEIFDTVSQGAEDSIEVSITRGHLTVIPLSSLIVQSGTNTTFNLKVVSVYNDNIPYRNEAVNIHVKDSSSTTIINKTISTNMDGTFGLQWNNSMGPPGIYDLVINGFGNDDFLSFSKTLHVNVVPASSNLVLLTVPESIPCQSPDGSHFEYADIIVKHTAADQTGIDDSILYWNTSFGSGELTNLGNGEYNTTIPFQTASGIYLINITAVNPTYQIVNISIPIEAIKNVLSFWPIQNNWSVVHGNTTTIEFLIDEEFNWGEEILIEFIDDCEEINVSADALPDSSNTLIFTAWNNLSIGPHVIHPYIKSNYYEFSDIASSFELIVLGELNANISIVSAYYNENIQLNLAVFDNNNSTIELVTLVVYYDSEIFPFVTLENIDSTQITTVDLPQWIAPGIHLLRLELTVPYYIPIINLVNVSIWMRTNITITIEIVAQPMCPIKNTDSVFSYNLLPFHGINQLIRFNHPASTYFIQWNYNNRVSYYTQDFS
ncbi:MAG: hypothetical protein OEV85_07345 [Candidatus Thorarchaeota archaeon]|nr:hypothetical protein [Candidatus Thorarchaeota archaeon]